MHQHTDEDRLICLALLFQVAEMVHQIATTGVADFEEFRAAIYPLRVSSPQQSEDLLMNKPSTALGFQSLVDAFDKSKRTDKTLEILRYVMSLMLLERKIAAQSSLFGEIALASDKALAKEEFFGEFHPNVIAALAQVYSDHISQLQPPILVRGERQYLDQSLHANRIRALLLSGIRMALAWRQVGGHRWQLLFKRKSYIQQAQGRLDRLSRQVIAAGLEKEPD